MGWLCCGIVEPWRRRLTFFLLVVFPQLHAFEGCGAADDFVAEFGLVLVAAGAVDFLVGVSGFIWDGVSLGLEV